MEQSPGCRLRRRAFLALACQLFLVSHFFSEAYTDVSLVPREVFVGDLAELSFTTTLVDAALSPGEERIISRSIAPVSKDMTVETVIFRRFSSGPGTKILIAFTPWSIGTLQIPTISLEGYTLAPPSVRVESLIEKTGLASLQPARPPLLIPGTVWKVLVAILCILAAAILTVTFGKRGLAALFLDSPAKKSRYRLRRLEKTLRYLDRTLSRASPLEWYAQFSSAARDYFGSVCEWSIVGDTGVKRALTTREFRSAFDEAFSLEGKTLELRETLASLIDRSISMLARIEEIRFSGKPGIGNGSMDSSELIEIASCMERCILDMIETAASQKEPSVARLH